MVRYCILKGVRAILVAKLEILGITFLNSGSECGNKNDLAKKSDYSKENSLPQAKKCLGFGKRFSKFAKGIYETCDRNFFNLALTIVVFLR